MGKENTACNKLYQVTDDERKCEIYLKSETPTKLNITINIFSYNLSDLTDKNDFFSVKSILKTFVDSH